MAKRAQSTLLFDAADLYPMGLADQVLCVGDLRSPDDGSVAKIMGGNPATVMNVAAGAR